ncbi:hypothetical protein APED_33335 [Acanthopleuribacter pedis]
MCTQTPSEKNRVSIHREIVAVDSLLDVFEVVRAVPLADSVLEFIPDVSKVLAHSDGDLFIGDFKASQLVRTNGNGELLHAYIVQGEGPGEISTLRDFTITGDQVVIFGAYKAVVFSIAGDLLHERKYSGQNDITALMPGVACGDLYYVQIGDGRLKGLLENTTVSSEVHFTDDRLDLLPFSPTQPMGCHNDDLFITDNFDLTLYRYTEGQRTDFVLAPSEVDFSGLVPNERNKSQKMRLYSERLRMVNRWEYVFSTGQELCLIRVDFSKNATYVGFFKDDELVEYGPLNFLRTEGTSDNPLALNDIVGSAGGDLIGYTTDHEALSFLAEKGYSDGAKPQLVFLQVNRGGE